MPLTYNGYSPGEYRTTPATTTPGPHTVAAYRTGWNGGAFRLTHTVICECGKQYSSKADLQRALRSHEAHATKAT